MSVVTNDLLRHIKLITFQKISLIPVGVTKYIFFVIVITRSPREVAVGLDLRIIHRQYMSSVEYSTSRMDPHEFIVFHPIAHGLLTLSLLDNFAKVL